MPPQSWPNCELRICQTGQAALVARQTETEANLAEGTEWQVVAMSLDALDH